MGATEYMPVLVNGSREGWMVYYGEPQIAGLLNVGTVGNRLSATQPMTTPHDAASRLPLKAYLETFKDGLAERGEHIKSQEIVRWIEEGFQELSGSPNGETTGGMAVSERKHYWSALKGILIHVTVCEPFSRREWRNGRWRR
jgi:hypothetical protein